MVTETSIEAYESIKTEIGQRQQDVLNAFFTLGCANNKMIASFLRLGINQVTPRTVELHDIGLVTFSHEDTCPMTKRKTNFWKLTIYGEMSAEKIKDPVIDTLRSRPFIMEEGYNSNIYKAQIQSATRLGRWHNVEIKLSWDIENKQWFLNASNCDCEGFYYRKTCSHVNKLIDEIKMWGEI